MSFGLQPKDNSETPKKRTPEELASLMHEPENVAGGWRQLLSEFREHSGTWTEEQQKKGFEAIKIHLKDIINPWSEKFSKSISDLDMIFNEVVSEYSKIIEENHLLQRQMEEVMTYKNLVDARLADYKKLEVKITTINFQNFDSDEVEFDIASLFEIGRSLGFSGGMVEKLKEKMQRFVIILAMEKKDRNANATLKKNQRIEVEKNHTDNTHSDLLKTNRKKTVFEKFVSKKSFSDQKNTNSQKNTGGSQEKKHIPDADILIEMLFKDLEKVKSVEDAFDIFQKAHFRLDSEGIFSKNRTALRALKRAAMAKMRQVAGLSLHDISLIESGIVKGLQKEQNYSRCFNLAKKLGIPSKWF